MANITILELYPAGSELFIDCESFLNDLTNEGLKSLLGGQIISQATATAGYQILPNQEAMANGIGMFGAFEAVPNYTISIKSTIADWGIEQSYWEWLF